MNIKHSSASNSWGTPESILKMVREVLGSIDLDPASDAFFNQTVKALNYLTKDDEALAYPWPRASGSRVYPTSTMPSSSGPAWKLR